MLYVCWINYGIIDAKCILDISVLIVYICIQNVSEIPWFVHDLFLIVQSAIGSPYNIVINALTSCIGLTLDYSGPNHST